MMALSDIVKEFKDDFRRKYKSEILPSHRKALSAWEKCRTLDNNYMLIQCETCGNMNFVPHSCGHRNCPHCQNYETDRWIYRQKNKLLPVEHYLITFKIPPELNRFTWGNQWKVYSLLIEVAWNLIRKVFEAEHGIPGAIAVLHTHTRDLRYHPHVHFLVPNVILDVEHKTAKLKVDFLSGLENLAPHFGAFMLSALAEQGLTPPTLDVKNWRIDCKNVGSGEEALLYLGRNLYKGPLLEKDIISCKNGKVTFQYRDKQTREKCFTTEEGPKFLWLLLQHILPKNFRRARNFGFMSGNSKDTDKINKILAMFKTSSRQTDTLSDPPQRPQFTCSCCGHAMKIIATNIPQYTPSTPRVTDRMRM